MAKAYIGTSGWYYKEWGKVFFPEDLPKKQHLPYLAERFPTVELNASFYRLQPKHNYELWASETPAGFQFAIKVSRYLTHIKRLKDPEGGWKRLFEPTEALGAKRGPFLVQFPAFFKGTEDQIHRVDNFLVMARTSKRNLRFAFEFRSKDCFSKEMLEVLKQRRAALVFANSSKFPEAPKEVYADFVYYRLHGPREMFSSGYSDKELEKYAAEMKQHLKAGRDVYAYFNNDVGVHAPKNAATLLKLLG
jgi:uncharacterized protein YecE (DUF72 family)